MYFLGVKLVCFTITLNRMRGFWKNMATYPQCQESAIFFTRAV